MPSQPIRNSLHDHRARWFILWDLNFVPQSSTAPYRGTLQAQTGPLEGLDGVLIRSRTQSSPARQKHTPRATHSPHPGPGKPAVSGAPPSSRTHQRNRCCSNLHTAVPGHRCSPASRPGGEEGSRKKQEKNKGSQSTCKKTHGFWSPSPCIYTNQGWYSLSSEQAPGSVSCMWHLLILRIPIGHWTCFLTVQVNKQ